MIWWLLLIMKIIINFIYNIKSTAVSNYGNNKVEEVLRSCRLSSFLLLVCSLDLLACFHLFLLYRKLPLKVVVSRLVIVSTVFSSAFILFSMGEKINNSLFQTFTLGPWFNLHLCSSCISLFRGFHISSLNLLKNSFKNLAKIYSISLFDAFVIFFSFLKTKLGICSFIASFLYYTFWNIGSQMDIKILFFICKSNFFLITLANLDVNLEPILSHSCG